MAMSTTNTTWRVSRAQLILNEDVGNLGILYLTRLLKIDPLRNGDCDIRTMSNDAGMLSAAVGAAGCAQGYHQSPSPRYYQCNIYGLNATCSKITYSDSHTSLFHHNSPHAIIEIPSVFPESMDHTYVAWRIRNLQKVRFTATEEAPKSP